MKPQRRFVLAIVGPQLLFAGPACATDIWKQVDKLGHVSDLPAAFRLPDWNGWTSGVDAWGHEFRTKKEAGGTELKVDFGAHCGPDWDRIPVTRGTRQGFVDERGKIVIQHAYVWIETFNQGLVAVRESKKTPWKLIDKNGDVKFVLPEEMKPSTHNGFPGMSKEKLFPVERTQVNEKTTKGLYDFDKRTFLSVGSSFAIEDFSEGLARVNSVNPMKFGFIDRSGKIVIPLKFDHATKFQSGTAAVMIDNRWGFIDHSGKMVIKLPVDCSSADSFHEGLAAVALGGDKDVPKYLNVRKQAHWGFIDKTGKVVIPAKFFIDAHVGLPINRPHFNEGLAHVALGDELNHKYGFIDKNGNWVIKPTFKDAGEFKDGHAHVCLGQTGFSKDNWNASRNGYFYRDDVFRLFLKQYRLIGMHQNEIVKLLGEPAKSDSDGVIYGLTSTGCGNAYKAVKIHYEYGVATKYKFLEFEQSGDWIDSSPEIFAK